MSKPDMSVLKPPLHLGISGVRHIMECMNAGTEEVKLALIEECDVILECKVCKSMFRALPNYLAHKRVYCPESYQEPQHRSLLLQNPQEERMIIIEPQPPVEEQSVTNEEAQEESGAAETSSKSIEKVQDIPKGMESAKDDDVIELEPVEGNPNAVQQVTKKKSETPPEVQNRTEKRTAEIEADVEAKKPKTESQRKTASMNLRPNPVPKVKSDLVPTYKSRLEDIPNCSTSKVWCQLCKVEFSTHKNLYSHMMNLHSNTRTYYPCPICSLPFTKLYNVMGHLMKRHKKSKAQVEKMREKLRNMAFKKRVHREEGTVVIHENIEEATEAEEEERNMNPIVSLSPSVAHKCETCGRSFAKKDSLSRHFPFCMHRRKAITNDLDPVKKVDTVKGSPSHNPLLAEIYPFRGFDPEMMQKIESLVDEDNKQCTKCKTCCDSLSQLHLHVVRHLGLKRFKCKLCKFTCQTRSRCKCHLQRRHGSHVAGFSLLQFRNCIIDLHPEKPLPINDLGPFVCVPTINHLLDGQSGKSRLTKALASLSKKSSKPMENDELGTSEVLEIDPMDNTDDEEEAEKLEEQKTTKRKEDEKKKTSVKNKTVTKSPAVEKDTSNEMMVLSTRSGVKYKKPTLEEILQTKVRRRNKEEESDEEEEEGAKSDEAKRQEKKAKIAEEEGKRKEVKSRKDEEKAKRAQAETKRKADEAKREEEKKMTQLKADKREVKNAYRVEEEAAAILGLFKNTTVQKKNITGNPSKTSSAPNKNSNQHQRSSSGHSVRTSNSESSKKSGVSQERPRSTPPIILSSKVKKCNRRFPSLPIVSPKASLGSPIPSASHLLKQSKLQSEVVNVPGLTRKYFSAPSRPRISDTSGLISKAPVILSPADTSGTSSQQLKLSSPPDITVDKQPQQKSSGNKFVVITGTNQVLDAVKRLRQHDVQGSSSQSMYVMKDDHTLQSLTKADVVKFGGFQEGAASSKDSPKPSGSSEKSE